MELANTTLINEVIAISNSTDDHVRYGWECVLEAGGRRVAVYKLLSIDEIRDYAGAYADEVMVEVMIGAGTFAEFVMPFKEELTMVLYKVPIAQDINRPALNKGIISQRFRATLTEAPGDTVASPTNVSGTAEEMDRVSIRRVTLQLQDIALEQIRMMSLGTSIRRSSPAQALRALITNACQALHVDRESQVKGLTMVSEHNTEVRDHILIPHGTPLVNIPDFLQDKAGGIYSAGLGFYLQKDMWYVWPLFDLSRLDTSPKTITVILLGTNQLNSVEKTYRTTPHQTIIMVTGGAVYDDATERSLHNQGNGVRFADSRRMMEGFGEVKNNKVVAKRTFNNNEFVAVKRTAGLNNVQMAGITNNVFAEASKLAKRKGALLTVNWQNSNPDLIRPDIPVKVIYARDGLPVTLSATVMQCHTYIASESPGIATGGHMSNTALTLFVEKDLPELKTYLAEQNR